MFTHRILLAVLVSALFAAPLFAQDPQPATPQGAAAPAPDAPPPADSPNASISDAPVGTLIAPPVDGATVAPPAEGEPPADTRAHGRGLAVSLFQDRKYPYVINWDAISLDNTPGPHNPNQPTVDPAARGGA